MNKDIFVSTTHRLGIRKNHKGFPKHIRYASCDTETYDDIDIAKPCLLQFCDENYNTRVFKTKKETIEDDFLFYVDHYFSKDFSNILFFFNLEFDLFTIFLSNLKKDERKRYFYDSDNKQGKDLIELYNKQYNVSIKIFCAKSSFATISFKNKSILCIDLHNFFKCSLESTAKITNKKYFKMSKPSTLGKNIINNALIDYAENDVLVTQEVSDFLIKQFKTYDIKPCVSIAQMGMRIFKHLFLRNNHKVSLKIGYKIKKHNKGSFLKTYLAIVDLITYPLDSTLEKGCILSYHGGKNGFYLTKTSKINNVFEYDVNSMYPYAFLNIANFNHAIFKKTDILEKHGVYCISGYVKKSKYPIIFSHDFKKVFGRINNLWLTSYEIKKALLENILIIDNMFGYCVIENKKARNPFTEYVRFFYKHKNECKDKGLKLMYKLLLNVLYGKTIQTMPYREINSFYFKKDFSLIEKNKLFKSGGMFNPFIATLITGFSRVKLYDMEKTYQSLDSATDSVKSIKPAIFYRNEYHDYNISCRLLSFILNKRFKGLSLITDTKLGAVSVKNFGNCLFIRNKCYIMFGKNITYASHGFDGGLDVLLKLYLNKKTDYTYQRMIKMKESFKRVNEPLPALTMQELKGNLNVKW